MPPRKRGRSSASTSDSNAEISYLLPKHEKSLEFILQSDVTLSTI